MGPLPRPAAAAAGVRPQRLPRGLTTSPRFRLQLSALPSSSLFSSLPWKSFPRVHHKMAMESPQPESVRSE